MLRWLLAVSWTVVLVSSYSVDVNNPPLRNNDIHAGGAGIGLGGQSPSRTQIGSRIQAAIRRLSDGPNPATFISSHGYPVEEYRVNTPDGYILTLFRIPHGVKNATNGERKEPVFIQHGLMSSAMDFLVTGPDHALGFVMADAGYDVWLGNTRGSTYSRAHRDLSPDSKQFWQFSYHEIGERDLPTMIKFVLQKTNYKKLHYVGHGMGTTALFVMCHMRPEMQSKIQSMNALAPIAYTSNMYSPLVRYMASSSSGLSKLYEYTNTGEVTARDDLMRVAGYDLCRQESPNTRICDNLMYLIGGWGSNQLDSQQISDILKYSPSSSSIFQLAHFSQGVHSGMFSGYDFGTRRNMDKYSKPTPPKYDTTAITSRLALHYSDNDWLSAVSDVDKLGNKVQNLVGKYRVPDSKFGHMDFCWGKDAKRYVYDRVIGVMRRFPMQSSDYRGDCGQLTGDYQRMRERGQIGDITGSRSNDNIYNNNDLRGEGRRNTNCNGNRNNNNNDRNNRGRTNRSNESDDDNDNDSDEIVTPNGYSRRTDMKTAGWGFEDD